MLVLALHAPSGSKQVLLHKAAGTDFKAHFWAVSNAIQPTVSAADRAMQVISQPVPLPGPATDSAAVCVVCEQDSFSSLSKARRQGGKGKTGCNRYHTA